MIPPGILCLEITFHLKEDEDSPISWLPMELIQTIQQKHQDIIIEDLIKNFF